MSSTLQKSKHDENLYSIKVDSFEVDITSPALDGLFVKLVGQANKIYFRGERLNFENSETELMHNLYPNLLPSAKKNKFNFLAGIPATALLWRGGLKIIWDQYEFASLYFICSDLNEAFILDKLSESRFVKDTAPAISKIIVLYKGIEMNVLWIHTNHDVIIEYLNGI